MNLIEYAIKMENDGEAFYREQAILNEGGGLSVVCEMLARDEAGHARVLAERVRGVSCMLGDSDVLSVARNVFADMVKNKDDMRNVESQLDFYRLAAGKEEESIRMYSELLEGATSGYDIELYEYLIGQEREHLAVLGELVRLLEHADDWVESAEFGNREEY